MNNISDMILKKIPKYGSSKLFSRRTILLTVLVIMIVPAAIIIANADAGDVISTVEINDTTLNGPVLNNNDLFGILMIIGIGNLLQLL